MNFKDRDVVITGGTGGLGQAVVGALLEAGATCHVPYIAERELQHFAHREHPKVRLMRDIDLTRDEGVASFYESVPNVWASIHLAGGFAALPLVDTKRADLMHQIELNLVTSFLCCQAAVRAMVRHGNGGRIVNVAARPALEWRTGAGMTAYTATKAAVAALTRGARRGGGEERNSCERGRTLDHRHAGEPRRHAEGRPLSLAEAGGDCTHDRIFGLA